MKKLLDGTKNAILMFSGTFNGENRQELVDKSCLEANPEKLRLEAVLYSVEKEVYIRFDDVVIHLSGRGKLDFEQFHSVPVENGEFTVGGDGAYFLMIDLEKH